MEASVLNALRNFIANHSAVTPLEFGLIAAVIAVAFADAVVSRGPNMISQVSAR